MNENIKKAFEIAKRDLRSCYGEDGIYAGLTHFRQYWARDSFFASLGATAIGDLHIAEKQVDAFLLGQRKDGMIPALLGKKLTPVYRPLVGEVVDANALFVIAFMDCISATKDMSFAEKNYTKVENAVEWLIRRDSNNDGLIEEGLFANWADSILKFGKVLYSNCCYCKALTEFSKLAEILEHEETANNFEELAKKTARAINENFWMKEKGHYADWIDFRKHAGFASDGNALAMAWEIASEEQAKKISDFVKEKKLDETPLRTNYPKYSLLRVPFVVWPFAARNYHNGFSWLWLGCMHSIGLKKAGLDEDAKEILGKIAERIVENNEVHEIFHKNKPVNSLMLKSEHPFAWSSGLYIRACREVFGKDF